MGDIVYRPNKVLSSKGEQIVGKLAPRFVGPFMIRTVVTPVIVELETMDGKTVGRTHIKNLKLVRRAEAPPEGGEENLEA